ncbi:alkaline phosphatase family protein [Mucisphaera sp.]|uniref:alkaline phosphatase family protein n=1 Tax=Mucisphaera sp. TaxID=2913024 RepID=UPI003D0FE8CA
MPASSRKLAVLNLVALTQDLLQHAPCLTRFAESGSVTPLQPVFPAVTSTVQSSILTGTPPSTHGVVANGWYERDQSEVRFWKQSNRLVQAPSLWDTLKQQDPAFTCANLFWWFNMATTANITVTPRPIYKADGRKLPDCYTQPLTLRDELQARLGTFPLFKFWGPAANIRSSNWIANAAKHIVTQYQPNLLLVYLPHLDYPLQKLGPNHANIPAEVQAIDTTAGSLINHLQSLDYDILILSEYAIETATAAITPNRTLREHGYLQVRSEDGLDEIDTHGSRALAIADHQIAHIYIHDPNDIEPIRHLFENTPGIQQTLNSHTLATHHLNHPRSGDIVLIPEPGHWFAYDFWLDDHRAPDYARTVNIHRKPGYDPRELFLDPNLRFPQLHIARRLLARKLGFRNLLDVIPLDNSLVRGTHGRPSEPHTTNAPLLITPTHLQPSRSPLPSSAIHNLILDHFSS